MAFNLEQFIRLRPYLYHLTYSANVNRIVKEARLYAAGALIAKANENGLSGIRRTVPIDVHVDGDRIKLRDQKPLHRGAVQLGGGWAFEDLVRYLNGFVFFLAGKPQWTVQVWTESFRSVQR